MKFFLIVAKGKKQGLPIPIEVDLFLIGSDKICQLRANHDSIGEQHCGIQVRDRKVFVRDFDSGHPTLINDEAMPPSEEWPLHPGDLIEVGPLKFMINYHEKALSQRDLEEWALKCLDQDNERKITAIDRLEASEGALGDEHEDASSAASAIIERMNAVKGIVKGRLRISREEGLTIVRLNDVYLVEEAELSLIKKELRDNLSRNNLKVLIDFKNVRRMSSQAAEMFGEMEGWLKGQGSKMAVCRVREDMVTMWKTFPATKRIAIFRDHNAASTGKW